MRGSCHCGAVAFEATRIEGPRGHCHCITCRKHGYILRVASLDDDPGLRPSHHIWTSHDVPWLVDEGEVPRYAEWQPGR